MSEFDSGEKGKGSAAVPIIAAVVAVVVLILACVCCCLLGSMLSGFLPFLTEGGYY
jgi:phosphotransferase system  glucose/maltose/N-acetylglucosamine-specific IIC component